MKRLLFLFAVFATSSCAKSAQDLSPFPCALNLTCPEGLACVNGVCAAGRLDALCTTGADPTDCGTGASCSAISGIGVCGSACTPDCPPGRACTGATAGVCLIDCTDGIAACPPNTVCTKRSFDSRMLCVAPPSCASVDSVRSCTNGCESMVGSTTCNNGAFTCPANTTCLDATMQCLCNEPLDTIFCPSGVPCEGAECIGGTYFCAPNPSTFDCNSEFGGTVAGFSGFQGGCRCRDGRTIEFTCSSDSRTCEQACFE